MNRDNLYATGLEVITGSMFSGKSEELIRRVKRHKYAKKSVVVFKHSSDKRYDQIKLSSHNKNMIESIPVSSPENILKCVDHYALNSKVDVVAIDEIQFFEHEEAVFKLIETLKKRDIKIIVAGLDQDFRGEPFTFMGRLMAIADSVDKLHAICMKCGQTASKTQRLVNGEPAKFADPTVLVGAEESYEARCYKCHEVNYNE